MNPVVHFEINAGPNQDKAALQEFYARTFTWTVESDNPFGYGMVDPGHDASGEHGIAGAIDASERGPNVILYIEVDDPDAYLERAIANGATLAMPVTAIPGAVTMAQFFDPAGNLIGIVGTDTPDGDD